MFRALRDFIVLSLDGSCAVEERLEEDQPATARSVLDHYIARPATETFNQMTLMNYCQQYSTPKQLKTEPSRRRKDVVVIVRPHYSPDPDNSKYEEYCQQKMMLYKPFRRLQQLLGECDTFAAAYVDFLQSGNVPPSLDDIHRLEQSHQQLEEDGSTQVCWSIPVDNYN